MMLAKRPPSDLEGWPFWVFLKIIPLISYVSNRSLDKPFLLS